MQDLVCEGEAGEMLVEQALHINADSILSFIKDFRLMNPLHEMTRSAYRLLPACAYFIPFANKYKSSIVSFNLSFTGWCGIFILMLLLQSLSTHTKLFGNSLLSLLELSILSSSGLERPHVRSALSQWLPAVKTLWNGGAYRGAGGPRISPYPSTGRPGTKRNPATSTRTYRMAPRSCAVEEEQ